MKKILLITPLALVLLAAGVLTGCGRKDDVEGVTLKEAKESGPVKPDAEKRKKIQEAMRKRQQQGSK